MKKILFLIESLSGGGAEKVLSTLLQHLDYNKFEVTLCCISDIGKYKDTVLPFVHYTAILPNSSNLKGWKLFIYKLKHRLIHKWFPPKWVYQWLIPHHADIEIAFVEGFATKLLAHSANKKAKKIAWIHIDLEQFHWTESIYKNIEQEEKTYQQFNQLITVSETARMGLQRKFKNVYSFLNFLQCVTILYLHNAKNTIKIVTNMRNRINQLLNSPEWNALLMPIISNPWDNFMNNIPQDLTTPKYLKGDYEFIDAYQKYLDAETQRDDMEIIKALYWLWGSQSGVTDGKGRFGVDTFNMSTDWSDTATESEFDILIDKIKGGIPLVVGFNSLSGGHAVNATRLLRDINNPLVYYLECYDNNDNSAPYFFKIEKSDIDFWTSTTVSNWGENYCYRTYLKGTGGWQTVSLYFTAITQ